MGAQTGLELGKKGSDIAAYKEMMNLKVVNLIPSSMAVSYTHLDCGGCARRLSDERDTQSGVEYAPHALHQHPGAQDACMRDDGSHYSDLYRQDRYIDPKSDAGA